jgi:periplasmic divalent cation tolerance protein
LRFLAGIGLGRARISRFDRPSYTFAPGIRRNLTGSPVSAAPDPAAVIVLTTFGADADGPALARSLVEERLAACVNVLPQMTSVYRWKGSVEEDREQQLLMKTTRERLPALEARLRALHPYEVPELLVLDVASGSAAYLAWLRESVSTGSG